MVRHISRQRGGLAALKLTKLFGIDDLPAVKDSGKVLIIIIYDDWMQETTQRIIKLLGLLLPDLLVKKCSYQTSLRVL